MGMVGAAGEGSSVYAQKALRQVFSGVVGGPSPPQRGLTTEMGKQVMAEFTTGVAASTRGRPAKAVSCVATSFRASGRSLKA